MSFLIELAEDGNRAVECSRRDSSSFLNDHNYDNCNFLNLLLKHRLIHCWQLRVRGKLNVIILWDIYDQHSLLSSWVLRIHSMSLNSCALSQSRPGKLPTNVRNNFRGALRPLWQDELVIRRRRRSTKIDENWGWTIHIWKWAKKVGNRKQRRKDGDWHGKEKTMNRWVDRTYCQANIFCVRTSSQCPYLFAQLLRDTDDAAAWNGSVVAGWHSPATVGF